MPTTDDRVPAADPLREKSTWERIAARAAATRAATWFLLHVGEHVDPWLLRISRGRINSTFTDAIVVLTNVGRRSGAVRHTPLVYFTRGDDVILIASNGGGPTHPAWYHNVVADPDVGLHVGPRGGRYRVREADGEERAALWAMATTMYPGYDAYARSAAPRTIPVLVCEPAG